MYDESEAHFLAQPIGPFETIQPSIEAAKNHFMSREIKLKEVRGSPLPQTSYAYDYPPRPLPLKEGDQESSAPVPFPFTSRSENMDQFFEKPLGVRPVTPQVFSPSHCSSSGCYALHHREQRSIYQEASSSQGACRPTVYSRSTPLARRRHRIHKFLCTQTDNA